MDRRAGLSTTLLLAAAAVAMALVAIFGDHGSFTVLTIAAALVGLVPWALVAGGVAVAPPVFAVMAVVPAVLIVNVAGNPGGMFPLMLLVTWITRSARAWLIITTILAAGASMVTLALTKDSAEETGLVYFLGGIGISWLAGLMLRRQEALTAEVQAMHELQVEQMAATERTRIAREVHDVVAHSLTVVMLNVTGARRALATQPERADEALGRAEDVGRASLDSIRQVMGLLREPGTGRDLPQPGAVDVPGLIEGYRSAGSSIEASIDPVIGQLDPALQLVLYRVVQESLSNVLQHAFGAAAAVELTHDQDDDRVRLSIVNGRATLAQPGPAVRTGLGVRGMGERVRATGGVLQAGPTADGGWRVTATIPARLNTRPRATVGDLEQAWAPTAR